jgi:glycosyltransferase involved in cell wall biosynthesis
MRWSLIAAVNDEKVLTSSLLASPDVAGATNVVLKKRYPCAGAAYNAGIDESEADILVFAHQDVYLPPGWIANLEQQIAAIEKSNACWAVLGVVGVAPGRHLHGYVYSTGLNNIVGAPFGAPVPVSSVDEMLIVVRKGSGLRFDPDLPGFHLYGTDICLEAIQRGLSCYALSNFCIHNSNGLKILPWAFWRCYLYLRRKWRSRLPISTPCVTIHAGLLHFAFYLLRGAWSKFRQKNRPGRRVVDPAALYRRLSAAESETGSSAPGIARLVRQ